MDKNTAIQYIRTIKILEHILLETREQILSIFCNNLVKK
jgi:hypothetical protein